MTTNSSQTENDSLTHQTQKPVQVAQRLENFKTRIFSSDELAVKYKAINLGQGFPNFDGPDFIKEAAIQAIKDGKNQFAHGHGVSDLNTAISARFWVDTGLAVDLEKEVTVTFGCTEAIAATVLGLINPGDEVIVLAPFNDSYEATLSMAGAKVIGITLRPPDFAIPMEELKAAVSNKTQAILVNTKLAFEMDHISIASFPGMYERTVTMNSLGKTFSLNGWKIS